MGGEPPIARSAWQVSINLAVVALAYYWHVDGVVIEPEDDPVFTYIDAAPRGMPGQPYGVVGCGILGER